MEVLVALRHRRSSRRALARAPAGRQDPLLLRHDRARGRLVRRHQHSSPRIVRDGDEYVVNGTQVVGLGGMGDPRCEIADLHGPERPRQAQPLPCGSRMILVPLQTPRASTSVRMLSRSSATTTPPTATPRSAFDMTSASRPSNMLLGEGRGFEIAQGRLGPGPHPSLHAADRPSPSGRSRRCAVRVKSSAVAFGKPVWPNARCTIRADVANSRIRDRAGAAADAEGGTHDGHRGQQGGAGPRSR